MADIYQEISDQIMKRLEDAKESGKPFFWIKPWSGVDSPLAVSYQTSKPYSGLNQIMLGFINSGGEYLTFNQIKQLSEKDKAIKLKKGSKGIPIFYYDKTILKDPETKEPVLDEDGNEQIRYFIKKYIVFDRENVDALPTKLPTIRYDHTPDEHFNKADSYIQLYAKGAGIELDIDVDAGRNAFFVGSLNQIRTPSISGFSDVAEWYSTVFHEIGHSTGTKERLNRDMSGEKISFDKEKRELYAREELCAEIFSCMALARFGIIKSETMDNASAYIDSWMKAISECGKTLIPRSCTQADKALKYFFDVVEKEMIKELSNENEMTFQLPSGGFIHLQVRSDLNVEYDIYSSDYKKEDGGILEKNNLYDAMTDILSESDYKLSDIWTVDTERFLELADKRQEMLVNAEVPYADR